MLSIIIPAHNEEKNLPITLAGITQVLDKASINFEVIVVNDHSTDNTEEIVRQIFDKDARIKLVGNKGIGGYGFAVRRGLEVFSGDAVVIAMADSSDDPEDIAIYFKKVIEGYDCVFGTRFCRRANVSNYPWSKLILNRIGNFLIQGLFFISYNDVTNAFKCYSKKAIEGMSPLVSSDFNLTVEMPLKAIIRGYRWCVVPTNWYGRVKGVSKWKVKEMGSRYLITLLYLWFERVLSRKTVV